MFGGHAGVVGGTMSEHIFCAHLPGPKHSAARNTMAMRERHESIGTRLKWLGLLVAVLLLVSAVPGAARVSVFFGPGVVVPFGPFWGPYWEPYWTPYPYPPVIVAPPPPVYVQPAPPAAAQPPPPSYWYYCENPQGYYPYVQQCPGGWQQVPARPQ